MSYRHRSTLLGGVALGALIFNSCFAQPPRDNGPPRFDEISRRGENAEQPRGPRGFGPPGFGPGGPRDDLKLVKEFDQDDNGWLNRDERAKARVKATAEGGERRRGPGGGPGGRGRGQREPAKPGRAISPSDVTSYDDAELYDPSMVRTLFFEFENEDWESELEDFHGTDVDVPAMLTVDGKTYPNVGMRFRGMSSYGMVPTGYKRSFNVSLDLADEDQRLYGYKTLNLLNSSGDPSFMSTVLYSHIASKYIPVPKANHVHVVINGESWGVYVNVQQFNKDFLGEHFDSTKGTRWKVSGSPGGDGGLRYLGDELEPYKERFEMKSNDGKKAWKKLVQLCKTLNETPLDQLERELDPLLDIDGTLRFLALDVALVNSDGYWTRASDYSLFLDQEGRFHIIPHDMNEAFSRGHGGGRGPGRGGPPPGFDGPPPGFDGPPPPRFGGNDREGRRRPGEFGGPGRGPAGRGPEGRGPEGRGPEGRGPGGVDLDPLVSAENPRMPLHSRLLAVPKFRAKYLGYIREIAEDSLDWQQLEPFVRRQAELISDEVAADTRKLDRLEAFNQANSLEASADAENSLRSFFEKRRAFLLKQ
ncbi:CotH kinase family protein [Roseiconus lacunae]|uniref:CotH kinase family protein n=1 Tax=Roseiconus lacunae TaxID=2605694 RepID=UPI001E4548F6|nr:CotH kinase family protein [Roseiconus lacunae]MCD0460578.1 CotH kinase family protein [Roseiconus lacunae]